MRKILLLGVFVAGLSASLPGQNNLPGSKDRQAISALIAQYQLARETRDTALLRGLFDKDIDQLVSSGEWRTGIDASLQGMLNSSANNPGTRSLRVDRVRKLSAAVALVDCRYEIQQINGTTRNMWSSFTVIKSKGNWKITAIRNMLPAAGP